MTPQIRRPLHTDLVVLDNFYADPDAVRALALSQEFHRNDEYHKVQRTHKQFLFPGLTEVFAAVLRRKIRAATWDKSPNGVFQLSLAGDKVVYHADGQQYAAVVFLTPDAPPESGTAFLRSRATKGRTVAESLRLLGGEGPQARAIVNAAMFKDKLLDPTAWDEVDVVGNVYNRCVIWNARLAHAGRNYFGTTKEAGRLVQQFFFDAE